MAIWVCIGSGRRTNMKKVMSPQEIIEQYIETCLILKETALSGDYKKGNKEGEKVVRIFSY